MILIMMKILKLRLTGNERGDGSDEIGDEQVDPRERGADEEPVLLVTLKS